MRTRFFPPRPGRRPARPWRALCAALLAAVLLGGCAAGNDRLKGDVSYLPLANATRTEMEQAQRLRDLEHQLESRNVEPPAPVEPLTPTYNPLEEIPITITMRGETLHNVLYVVARNAGLNLVIEPDISLENTITISFVDTPSSVVVSKLLKAYDLAWDVSDNTLFVQRYAERMFKLDFINAKTEVELDNGGDIYGSASDTSGAGGLEGNFKISSTYGKGIESDSLYDFLKKSLEEIVPKEAAVKGENGERFVLDPVAGSLLVRTTPSKMASVAQLVNDLKAKMARQVIIEARILQVTLSDNFSMGIQWSWVMNRIGEYGFGVQWAADHTVGSGQSAYVVSSDQPAGVMQLTRSSGEEAIQATVEALQTFGGVKVISNPHIRARHGQPALITSGTTERYISQITRTTDDNSNTNYSTTTASAFSGVMLGVYPFVNDLNEVDLQIFPIKSDSDLTRTATVGDDTITLPVTEVQNVSTTLKVHSGDTIVIGGMIEKNHSNADRGLPGAMDVPVLGWLFKDKVKTESATELVILMHVKVI
jgi:MSHA type pilus biogenesis protein MshL